MHDAPHRVLLVLVVRARELPAPSSQSTPPLLLREGREGGKEERYVVNDKKLEDWARWLRRTYTARRHSNVKKGPCALCARPLRVGGVRIRSERKHTYIHTWAISIYTIYHNCRNE